MEYRVSQSLPAAYVALGFLIIEPQHGYDLRQRLSEGLGELWHVAMSQLYSVLHKLVESGWAVARVEPQPGRPSRHTYAATEDGRRAFWEWVSTPVARLRDLRVVFLAKIYFLRRLRPESVGDLIEAQRRQLEGLLGSLAKRKQIGSDDAAVGVAALEYRRAQIETALQWLGAIRRLFASTKETG